MPRGLPPDPTTAMPPPLHHDPQPRPASALSSQWCPDSRSWRLPLADDPRSTRDHVGTRLAALSRPMPGPVPRAPPHGPMTPAPPPLQRDLQMQPASAPSRQCCSGRQPWRLAPADDPPLRHTPCSTPSAPSCGRPHPSAPGPPRPTPAPPSYQAPTPPLAPPPAPSALPSPHQPHTAPAPRRAPSTPCPADRPPGWSRRRRPQGPARYPRCSHSRRLQRPPRHALRSRQDRIHMSASATEHRPAQRRETRARNPSKNKPGRRSRLLPP